MRAGVQFLLILSSMAVWLVRNQNLMEMWWTFLSLMRYPRAIFAGEWGRPFGLFFTFVVPMVLAVSVPAETMVKALDPWFIAWTMTSAILMSFVSRCFFRLSLRHYRSASS
jgi:ABC-2 type transport system permease protein